MTEATARTASDDLRWRSVVLPVVVAATTVLAPAASGFAAPPPIPDQPVQGSCSYRLDPPRRIDKPYGTAAVATTVSVTGCRGGAHPAEVTACIRADDSTQCRTKGAWLPAELEFRPWRPGSTYTATGRGCAAVGNPVTWVCTSLGPLSVDL